MEVLLKNSDVELTIKCTEDELQHFAVSLRELRDERYDEDCGCECDNSSCYECSGYTNYTKIKTAILNVANINIKKKKSYKKVRVMGKEDQEDLCDL